MGLLSSDASLDIGKVTPSCRCTPRSPSEGDSSQHERLLSSIGHQSLTKGSVMANFLILMGCLLAGIALRRFVRVPENAHVTLNAIIIHVSLPAISLRVMHNFVFTTEVIGPVLMPWLLFGLGAAVFGIMGRLMQLDRATIGALILVGGLGNTSFVGLPMIETLIGQEGLGLGLLIDQLGSYLVLSTCGIMVAALYSDGRQTTWQTKLRKVIFFPPFVAMLIALITRPLDYPAILDQALARIGDTVAPLALLSVGIQLRCGQIREHIKPLCLGLGYKLLACPALVIFSLWLFAPHSTVANQVCVIEAAMPPMIGAGVVAAQANLNTPLVSTLIGVGIPLGLLTTTAWHWVFYQLA